MKGRGWMVAALQLALLVGVLGQYSWDRDRYPRVWARTLPVDPMDPMRGRYVSLTMLAEPKNLPLAKQRWSQQPVRLVAEKGVLVAYPGGQRSPTRASYQLFNQLPAVGETLPAIDPNAVQIWPTLSYFIPENVPDPSNVKPGEELWVEVTVVPDGLPRPIRLEVRKKK